MKLALTTLAAAVALVVPVAASAHHGHGRLQALRQDRAHLFAIGTGTLTSGSFKSRVGDGTYTASIAATGAATTTPRGSCAPAGGAVTLTATGTTAASVTETATGRLCTASDANARIKTLFIGRVTVSAATGAAAKLNGGHGIVALVQKQDGTVRLLDAIRAPKS